MKRMLLLSALLLALVCTGCVQQEVVENEGDYLLYFPANTAQTQGGDAEHL